MDGRDDPDVEGRPSRTEGGDLGFFRFENGPVYDWSMPIEFERCVGVLGGEDGPPCD